MLQFLFSSVSPPSLLLGLDRGLVIRSDGVFCLRSPSLLDYAHAYLNYLDE